ncbi:MAG: hypothetical protein PHN68_09975 [Prolixibacteraceae bacterium]|nr:hypothetical protein [Prolixibacteraceae bacterium]MDD4755971.1 hypothetical protein [Prolixibacteraceae bacterium]
MKKKLNLIRGIIVAVLILTSIPLTITYFAGIDSQHELIVILHVIFGILFILVALPITMTEKRQQQKQQIK